MSDYGTVTSTFTTEDGHVRQHGKKLPGGCSVSGCSGSTSVIEDGENYCGGHDPIVARRNGPFDVEEEPDRHIDYRALAEELAAALKEARAEMLGEQLEGTWMTTLDKLDAALDHAREKGVGL